jgi:DNA-directed RNA polymerase subunit RPC12/RpoP
MDTYSVEYSCSNCGHTFTEQILKGTLAPGKVSCNNCDCRTATKNWPKETIHPTERWPTKPIKPAPSRPFYDWELPRRTAVYTKWPWEA